ncbi:MAG: ABC transporter permease [Cyclobacteriaceae bacterium]
MNLPYFISSRIRHEEQGSFSSIISKIAIASIALGLAAMIISFLILRGFENVIKEKIYDFSGHLQVTKYTLTEALEEQPISLNSNFYQKYDELGYIKHVQEFAHKPGLFKTDKEVQGVVIKGVSESFDLDAFKDNIIEGSFIEFSDSTYSNDILISRRISRKLQIALNDEVITYFVQDPPRFRKLKVVGIYDSGLEEFDNKMVIGDLDMIRRLNNWPDSLAGGLEVFINDPNQMDQAEIELFGTIDYDLYVDKVSDKYVQIFDWLVLINQNVVIFLVLVLFISSFNMVSILLILIMERTQMIGIFKALGARDSLLRRIFTLNGIYLVLKGMVLGNLIGIGLGFLQYQFHLIPLDPVNYYMSYVPIHWDFQVIFLLNLLTFILVNLTLLIPTIIVSRIVPVKAIRFG